MHHSVYDGTLLVFVAVVLTILSRPLIGGLIGVLGVYLILK
jgi:hypothetical protein